MAHIPISHEPPQDSGHYFTRCGSNAKWELVEVVKAPGGTLIVNGSRMTAPLRTFVESGAEFSVALEPPEEEA